MKLLRAHVKNYKCILDSNPVGIDQLTCLVGKNESGKTAFLKALEGINSTDEKYTTYDKTENYPRRFLNKYKTKHSDSHAMVISTEWELEDNEYNLLVDQFGEEVVTKKVTIAKSYSQECATWSVPVDEMKLLNIHFKEFGLNKDEKKSLEGRESTRLVAEYLEQLDERSDSQEKLLDQLKNYPNMDAGFQAIQLLRDFLPKFLYFSHYDQMSGQISINKLNQDRVNSTINSSDQVFLDFLEFAGTSLDELANEARFEELNSKCEAAAVNITDQIFNYWKQNDQLEIDVRLDEGKTEDTPPYNSGPVARARVKNTIHRVTVPFSDRSTGFIWFFSFLVKFAQIQKNQGNVIILLDEPGLTLHGTAQKDLLRYFREQLVPKHQLIYTTHSPFMVPADNFSCVRTVEDVVRNVNSSVKKESIGTKIRPDVLTIDPQTNFPLLGAMGFEVTQGLLISPNTLLVEGASDIVYLQAISNKLQLLGRSFLDPRWAVCPSGGIDKILLFVKFFYGNNLNFVVLTDFERGQRKKLDNLYSTDLIRKERIILATEIAGKDEADTEDFFDPAFFVKLVNSTYNLCEDQRLTVKKLDEADKGTKRLVKKAEAYFKLLPDKIPVYNHYRAAHYLLTHPEIMDEKDEAVMNTLDCFEDAIVEINKFTN